MVKFKRYQIEKKKLKMVTNKFENVIILI